MSNKTGIEWTDATWNPCTGCTKVSDGCKFCYAKTLHDSRHAAKQRGRGKSAQLPAQYDTPFETVVCHPDRLLLPLTWAKPRRIFVNSMSDLFHEDVPEAFVRAVFGSMAVTPQHTFQILTKRPARMHALLTAWTAEREPVLTSVQAALSALLDTDPAAAKRVVESAGFRALGATWPLPHVWLGTSVETERFVGIRVPDLQATPAALRFLSCEPLLGRIHFTTEQLEGIGWVIVGGESGSDLEARPCQYPWVDEIVRACKAHWIPCFVKQVGRVPLQLAANGETLLRVQLKDTKGGDPTEWPARLRVRHYPRLASTSMVH